jgi:hypothetical protein
MLFMVIERIKGDNLDLVGERFKEKGRMLPEGVVYHTSWMEAEFTVPVRLGQSTRCYQLMEAENKELLGEWTKHWEDLVEFEIVPVVTSAEFWKDL